MMDNENNHLVRPLSIWLISLWSLTRAVSPILAIIGSMRIQELYLGPSTSPTINPYLPEWIRDLLLFWINGPFRVKVSMVVGLISVIGFLYAAIGIFLGHSWSRTLFFFLSGLLVIWNARLLGQKWFFIPPTFNPFLGSSAAIFFASWFFRQKEVDEFFGGDGTTPHILTRRVFNIPLDLGLAVLLAFLFVVFQVVSSLRMSGALLTG
jgi:hypothetical protein